MKWIGTQTIYDSVRFKRDVDITGNVNIAASGNLSFGGVDIIDDSSGTTTLKNIDALDATTIATFETAMESNLDTLNSVTSMTGLTTIGAAGATTNFAAGDITIYNAVNDGNPSISLGASATNRLFIETEYNSGTQALNEVNFITSTTSSTVQDGRFKFTVDDVEILTIRDAGINLKANMGIQVSGTDIITDSSGTATLSNIDALDATTESTIESAIDTLSNLTTVGTITSGTWNGGVIASAYLDADTAHISATKSVTHHVFTDNMGTTKHYVGLTEADAENTSTTNKFMPFPSPVAGKLLKVYLRSNKDLRTHDLTWRLELQGAVNFATGPSVIGTQSGAGCNNTTMTTYDFTTGLDDAGSGGTNVIPHSNMVYLSIQSDTSFGSAVIYYITCLWEWDLS